MLPYLCVKNVLIICMQDFISRSQDAHLPLLGKENSINESDFNNRSVTSSVPKRYILSAPAKGRNHIHYPPYHTDMNRAKSIVANNGGCCGTNFNCFTKNLTLPDAARIVYACRQELQNTESKAQLIDKLREKVNQCVKKVRDGSKYLKMEYEILTELKLNISMKDPVCRNSFMEAWGINLSLMKVLRKEIKQDILRTSHAITDRFSKVTGDFSKLLVSTGLDDVVDVEKLCIAKLPNTETAHHCYNWLENYFKLCGDNEPNSNEIHLDTVNKKDIYEEYVDESVSTILIHWDNHNLERYGGIAFHM